MSCNLAAGNIKGCPLKPTGHSSGGTYYWWCQKCGASIIEMYHSNGRSFEINWPEQSNLPQQIIHDPR